MLSISRLWKVNDTVAKEIKYHFSCLKALYKRESSYFSSETKLAIRGLIVLFQFLLYSKNVNGYKMIYLEWSHNLQYGISWVICAGRRNCEIWIITCTWTTIVAKCEYETKCCYRCKCFRLTSQHRTMLIYVIMNLISKLSCTLCNKWGSIQERRPFLDFKWLTCFFDKIVPNDVPWQNACITNWTIFKII